MMGHLSDEGVYRDRLRSQIKETYAKELYTRQTQNIAANRTRKTARVISAAQIVLTSISTVGLVSVAFGQGAFATVVACICSAISLALNLYSRGANLEELSAEHVRAANDLWTVEQGYLSLLTDFDALELSEIRERRNELQQELDSVYRRSPRTAEGDYKKARKGLKEDEAQSFEPGEADKLLPVKLRERSDEE